jgi:hypothetical protein
MPLPRCSANWPKMLRSILAPGAPASMRTAIGCIGPWSGPPPARSRRVPGRRRPSATSFWSCHLPSAPLGASLTIAFGVVFRWSKVCVGSSALAGAVVGVDAQQRADEAARRLGREDRAILAGLQGFPLVRRSARRRSRRAPPRAVIFSQTGAPAFSVTGALATFTPSAGSLRDRRGVRARSRPVPGRLGSGPGRRSDRRSARRPCRPCRRPWWAQSASPSWRWR